MPRYRTKLNDKDFKLLKKEGMGILGETGYLFPIFGNHIEDFVKFNVYGLDDTYLKSGISEDFENDDNNIKLKPGNDLRKMGFTRGDYKVKYFFYRRLAGADEVVLTKTVGDQSGVVHSGNPKLTGEPMGDFYVDDDGKVFQGNGPPADGSEPSELDVKEYKFYVDKISANKKEVRLAPQSINLDKYKDEFSSLYISDGVYKPVSGIDDFTQDGGPTVSGGAKFNSADAAGFKFVTKDGTDSGFLKKYVGGTIEIENAFIVGYIDQVSAAEENPDWSLEDPIPPITIEINYPDNTAIIDTPVMFTAKRENGNVAPSELSYYWDFGCGHEEFGTPEISHIYTIPGIMNVSLVVNSPNFSDTITMDPLHITVVTAEESTDDTTVPEIPIPLSSEFDGKIIGWDGAGTPPWKDVWSLHAATKGYPYTTEWNPLTNSPESGTDIGAPHMQNDTLWYIQSGHKRWISNDGGHGRNIRTLKLLKPGASLFVADVDGDGNNAPEHDELRISSYGINQLPFGPYISAATFTNVGNNSTTLALDAPIYEGGLTEEDIAPPAEYSISVQAGTGGTVSGQGGATTGGYFQEGTTISVHSNANPGWFFITWTDSSGQNEFTNITNNSTQLVVTADATITAVFDNEPPPEYNITLTADGLGTVVSNPTSSPFLEGSTIEITAIPNDGTSFHHWTDTSGQHISQMAEEWDEGYSDHGPVISVTAQAEDVITAHFTGGESYYTLSVDVKYNKASGNGYNPEDLPHEIEKSGAPDHDIDAYITINGINVGRSFSQTYVADTIINIEIVDDSYPTDLYGFVGWVGEATSYDNTRIQVMSEDVNLTAKIKKPI